MTVTSAKDLTFNYPSTPEELTLGSWGGFLDAYSEGLQEAHDAIAAADDEKGKESAEEFFAVEQAYALAAHFSGLDFTTAGTAFNVGEVLGWYHQLFVPAFTFPKRRLKNGEPAPPFVHINNKHWFLPEVEIKSTSPVTFGEIIDSKVLAENKDLPRWQLIVLLACIYLHPDGEPYREEDAIAGSERYKLLLEMPAATMSVIAKWFEEFNEYLQKTFPVFHPSRIKGGKFMKEHMQRWGWINFLKEIAKTKVFDIAGSGHNSIDCARRSNGFDVLMYASEDKDLQEALGLDQEEAYKK